MQTSRGKRRSEVSVFLAHNDAADVETVWGYYVNEALADRRIRVSAMLSWGDGYSLSCGDILNWVTPWQTTPIVLRCTSVIFDIEQPWIAATFDEVDNS